MGVVYSLSKIVLGRWKLEFSVETEEWPEVSRGLCWDLATSILKLQLTIRLLWEPPGCWQQDYHRGRAVYINARYLTGQACHYSSIFRYWKVADAVCTQRGLQRVLLMSRPARLTPHNQEKKKRRVKKTKDLQNEIWVNHSLEMVLLCGLIAISFPTASLLSMLLESTVTTISRSALTSRRSSHQRTCETNPLTVQLVVQAISPIVPPVIQRKKCKIWGNKFYGGWVLWL